MGAAASRRCRATAAHLLLLSAALLLAACAPEPAAFTGSTMGTRYSVRVTALPEGVDAPALQEGVDAVLRRVNDQMSTWQEDSELSRFNRSTGSDWFPVSADLVTVVEEARRISRLSGGAFDVTVGPLVNLWGFGPPQGDRKPPDEAQIQEAKARVGYGRIQVRASPPAIRKDRPDVYVDLSAIAKGYGVDKVAEYLESQGIDQYMVEIGGEVRARGHNPQGVAWRIGIERPNPGLERSVQRVMHIDGQALATSGDYRNYYEQDGVRLSHTIDPRTGRPIRHTLASVTVLSDTAMRADGLATALMVLGPEEGYALALREKLAAYFIAKSPEGFVEKTTPDIDRFMKQ
ncbi:MAG: FAD:protein FMN transferase [Pseudomonadota bacterium]|nr:FAD:protein FMN transferase [Pseudomonadota bacterium]